MVVIAGISGSVILWNHNKSGVPVMGSQAVKEASAEKGSISKIIVGTGNLEADTPVNVTVPSGVVIDEVKVESGDHVSAGDVLATVDNASVLSAMKDVQEKIENLDGVINETKDETEAGELTASVDGRVKRIYVSQGSSIADSMLENGAVMLLSIDGKMAVKLELTGAAAEGDSVTVILLDGSEKTGTIESIDGSNCVITFSDSGVGMGENVSVTDAEGTILGSGEAYIHQQLAVTATGGTVEEIKVSEDESVSAGTTLLTLTETTQSVKYLEALAEREAYAETLQELIELSGSGSVKAEMEGTIQSVNVSAGSSESSQNSSVSQTSVSGSSSGRVSNMSYQASDMRGCSYEVITLADTGGKMEESSLLTESSTEAETRLAATEQETKIQLEVAGEGESTSALLALAAPRAGEKPQSDIATADGSYTGTVTYQPGYDPFAADTVYQAQVQLTANEGWYFQVDSIFRIESGAVSGITVSSDNKILSFTITYPATEKNSGNDSGTGTTDQNGDDSGTGSSGTGTGGTGTDGTGSSSTGNSGAGTGSTGSSGTGSSGAGTGSTGSSGTGSSGTGSSGTGSSSTGNNGGIANSDGTGNDGSTSGSGSGTDNSTGNGTGTSGLGQTGSGSSGAGTSGSGTSAAALSSSGSSSGSSDSTDTAQASQYSTDVAAFTISSDDNMVLSVNVDELDINSVSKGQTAALTFDAIEDKEFEGEVTKVGSSASASGGVAKYSVNITVARDSRMKTGMNASATITVESREDVITIPVDAIQEKGNRTFVYTGRDAEGNLSDETEVTTGLSDGSTVEITEGLAEGDTVYYQRISSDNSSGGESGGMFGDFGGMGGGMMEDRGSGSGGKGNMPDFGGQGQMQSPPSMN